MLLRLRGQECHTSPIRALGDTGAQINLINENCVNQYNLPIIPCNMNLSVAAGQPNVKAKRSVCVEVTTIDGVKLFPLTFIVVPHILKDDLPASNLRDIRRELPEEVRLNLADPAFFKSAPINVLLGAEAWARLLSGGLFIHNGTGLVAQRTSLGWLLFGALARMGKDAEVLTIQRERTPDLAAIMQKFWEIDGMDRPRRRTVEDQQCEELFKKTHRRKMNGKYVVQIPLRDGITDLGSSRDLALRRFHQLEQRFERDPEMKEKYVAIVSEYIQLGHMKKASKATGNLEYHIPHHAVLQKFRVVFDASCKTTRGLSLNDVQLTGERLQDDLLDLIIRFRSHQYGLTTDIRQMYRCVEISPEQYDLQRVFWRERVDRPVEEYYLTTVTFGMTSAPYCAIRAMIQCTHDHQLEFPRAASIVRNDFYVDDCLTGASSLEEIADIRKEITELLAAGTFYLGRWHTNANQTDHTEVILGSQDNTTVLGLHWLIDEDAFAIRIQQGLLEQPKEVTKRVILSTTARLYDPCGYISPVLIVAKMLMQRAWQCADSQWDTRLPTYIRDAWSEFIEQLKIVAKIRIPRWTRADAQGFITIHGFSDASEHAYGAAVYLRMETEHSTSCMLITSKTKVAPIKRATIPRLELSAAEMLSSLMKRVKAAGRFNHIKGTFWTDSIVVLHWLRRESRDLKQFVGNRVAQIQKRSSIDDWRYVPTHDNPADLLSRGCSAVTLMDSSIWWDGPAWLKSSVECWPKMPEILRMADEGANEEVVKEVKVPADIIREGLSQRKERGIIATLIEGEEGLLGRYSSMARLLRVSAMLRRFAINARLDSASRRVGPITLSEKQNELIHWVKHEQDAYFKEELQRLTKSPPAAINSHSKISALNPRAGSDGIIRGYGRLERADLTEDQKHPILLPENSQLVWLLAMDAHKITLHGGIQQMLYYIRGKFWIPGLRRRLRKLVNKCVTCVRHKKQLASQQMSELPRIRVQAARPFLHSGVDFAGPFKLLTRGGRCRTQEKRYVAVFVCAATRAVHLELAEDLSSRSFIEVYRRFTAIRGSCRQLCSDNGTNFVGAEKELKEMLLGWQGFLSREMLNEFEVDWQFNAPAAPHRGGLWEAAIKSMKHHLRRVMGAYLFATEEFRTILAQVSAILNSRPLAAISDEMSDSAILTPGHFLIGGPIVQIMGECLHNMPMSKLKRWAQQQKAVQEFWSRWKDEYLMELQRRPKWAQIQKNLKVDDVVLIAKENSPPTMWPMGRIVEVHPGGDGIVRTATVKTEKSLFVRPVQKLCVLPFEAHE